MSVHRVLASGCNAAAARSCAAAFGRLSSPAATSTTACVHNVSRYWTAGASSSSGSTSRRMLSSKRMLQTATAHRPSTLEPESADHPQPPRNVKSEETSISSGTVPKVNDIRNPLSQAEAGRPAAPTDAESKPSAASQPTAKQTTSGESLKAKPRKLRPRKAAMTLTPTAVTQLRRLLDGPNPQLIRVGVRNRGCSGLAYHLEYVSEPGKFDETVEQDGVRVLVDSKALFSIIGSEMDWIEDKLSERFVFRNPNIKEECGCGESFMV